jgi:hypothetical protein
LVQEFITPELGFAVIPGGTQRFHFHFLKPAENDDIDAYATIQLANATGGTIGSPISTGIDLIGWVSDSVPKEVTVDLTLPTTTIDPTNRMIVKIYLSNNDSSSKTVTWYTEGTSYYAFVLTSVGVVSSTSGTSGAAGTSGIAGSSGSSGSNGATGAAGTSGTSGGGGGASAVKLANQTIISSGWTYNTGTTYYEYTYTYSGITTGSTVDITPYNDSLVTAQFARIFPYIQSNTGDATITAMYTPSGDITGEVIIS